MVVRVSKSKFKVRDQLSKTDIPVGSGGNQILQKASPSDISSLLLSGRKNMIINGSMEISQRGNWTSSAYSSSSQSKLFIMDRWAQQNAWTGGASWTVLNPTVQLPNGRTRKTFKLTQTSQTSSGFFHHYQPLEGTLSWKNQWITVSFWYRTNSHGMRVRNCNTTSCFTHGPFMIADGEWHKHVVTWRDYNGAAGAWQLHPGFHSPSRVIYAGEYIEFTEVQWEFGKVATPYEERTYAEELALCQRYFYINGGEQHTIISQAFSPHTTEIAVAWPHPTEMRASPTVDVVGTETSNKNVNFYFRTTGNSGFSLTGNGRSLAQMTKHHFSMWFNGMSGVPAATGQVRIQNAKTAHLHISAEL